MISQIIVIELQKYLGGKFILPNFLRNKPYNYNIDNEMIIDLQNVSKIFIN
jgi:hypothetical protein